MKKTILSLVQLPPPIHGASLMNEMIRSSVIINNSFDFIFFDISPESEQKNLGVFSIKKLVKVLVSYIRFFSLIMSARFELCYFTLSPVGFAFYKDLIYVAILKAFRKKIIFHLHGKGISREINFFKRSLYRFTFRNTDVIHLDSCLFNDIMSYRKFIRKEYVLPNGVKAFDLIKLKKTKCSAVTVTYLSNLIPTKGAHILLEAISFLPIEYSARLIFNIAGGGRDENYNAKLRELINLNSEFSINLLGPVYGDDKNLLLLNSDIFVLPTTYKNECFPLSILEAMQFGLAICSTNEGAISKIVTTNNGFIFDATDPKQLADALRKLVDDKDLLISFQQMSQKLFSENYTFDIFEKNLIEILESSMER